jgi:hypothetical protein
LCRDLGLSKSCVLLPSQHLCFLYLQSLLLSDANGGQIEAWS